MVQPLPRARAGDLLITAIILVLFNGVSFFLLLAGQSNVVVEPLRTIYTIGLGLAWPIAFLSALPLMYIWLKGRSVNKLFLSTATRRDLTVMMIAMGGIILSCLITVAAVIVRLVSELRHPFQFITIITVIVIVLFCSIVLLVVRMLPVVDATRKQMVNEQTEQPASQQNDKSSPPPRAPAFV